VPEEAIINSALAAMQAAATTMDRVAGTSVIEAFSAKDAVKAYKELPASKRTRPNLKLFVATGVDEKAAAKALTDAKSALAKAQPALASVQRKKLGAKTEELETIVNQTIKNLYAQLTAQYKNFVEALNKKIDDSITQATLQLKQEAYAVAQEAESKARKELETFEQGEYKTAQDISTQAQAKKTEKAAALKVAKTPAEKTTAAAELKQATADAVLPLKNFTAASQKQKTLKAALIKATATTTKAKQVLDAATKK